VRVGKGKGNFPYSIPSVGPGAGPRVYRQSGRIHPGQAAITFRQACGYLPSRRASPPFDRYQVILLGVLFFGVIQLVHGVCSVKLTNSLITLTHLVVKPFVEKTDRMSCIFSQPRKSLPYLLRGPEAHKSLRMSSLVTERWRIWTAVDCLHNTEGLSQKQVRRLDTVHISRTAGRPVAR